MNKSAKQNYYSVGYWFHAWFISKHTLSLFVSIMVFKSLVQLDLMVDWVVFQTVVKRGIDMENATDALIQLIKDHGRWVDPPAEE